MMGSIQELMLEFLIKIAQSDGEFAENEMIAMGAFTRRLPFFDDFPKQQMVDFLQANYETISKCTLDEVLIKMSTSFSQKQKDLAFILAYTVAMVDGKIGDGEPEALVQSAMKLEVSDFIASNAVDLLLTVFQGPDEGLKL